MRLLILALFSTYRDSKEFSLERFGLDNVDVSKTFKLSGTCTGIREFYRNIFYSTPLKGLQWFFSYLPAANPSACQYVNCATRLQVLRPETMLSYMADNYCYICTCIDTLKIKLALIKRKYILR